MGKHKFKLSDMIPNAWFYKLKDMNKTSKNPHSLTTYQPPPPPSSPLASTMKTTPKPETQCQSRKSYHITRELTIDHLNSPPRKSKSSSKSRKSTRRSSSISSFSSQSTSTSLSSRSKSRSPPSLPSFEETDVVRKNDNVGFLIEDALLKVKKEYVNEQSILDINALPHSEQFNHQLPPIITKQQTQSKNPTHKIKEQRNSPPSRRMSVSSPGGMRLKINSPKILGRKQGQNGNKMVTKKNTSSKKRRSISESFAVVKSSFDPQRDFKESMVEMIVQNNLTAAKDLEDLLTCYLTLNLDEYHDVIIKVFKQIWCDLRHPT